MSEFVARMGIFGELLQFLWARKLYWLIPLIITLIVFALLIIMGSNPIVGQFIYPFF